MPENVIYLGDNLGILRTIPDSSADLIHIDGNHSVRSVLKDWQYTDILAPHGVAVFHDINVHPGPAVVLDAVDPALFEIQPRFFNRLGDFGMAVVRRRRTNP